MTRAQMIKGRKDALVHALVRRAKEGKRKRKKNNGKKDTHTDGVCAWGREERRKIEGMVQLQESERPIAMEEKRKIGGMVQLQESERPIAMEEKRKIDGRNDTRE